jgi:hypothetical protein
VVVERTASVTGVKLHIGLPIELSKKIFGAKKPCSHHKGLVAVVARAPIAILKVFGHRNLGKLLTIAKYTKLGLAG